MRAYIDNFIKECEEWDEVEEDQFELDTGEKVQSKLHYKYLTNRKHYIEWRQWIVNDEVIYKSSILKDGFLEREGTATELDAETTELLDKIDDFLDERNKITRALPFFQKVLADDFAIECMATDVEFKLKVRDTVTFGDFKEVTETASLSKTTDVGENIKPIVRPFYPGLHVGNTHFCRNSS